MLLSALPAFGEEGMVELPGVSLEAETQWIWGDVVSVDKASRKITVRYLDYETDTEKEITIVADDNTRYENARSFDEIKPQDTLSIDYTIGTDGSNIARNISVEKPEIGEVSAQETFEEESTAVLDPEATN